MNEEQVKYELITPAIEKAGWQKHQIKFEYPVTDGKIIVRGDKAYRSPKKHIDYLLCYKDNLPLAIVEAKSDSKLLGDGMQQAQNYAQMLSTKYDVRFVFASNGSGFLFYDMKTATQKTLTLDEFPSPETLFDLQYKDEIELHSDLKTVLETPYYYSESSFDPRYYQRIAINRTVEAIAKGQDRVMLVMATGTGKTYMAFQIIYRLWKAKLKKKILYLADRNILVDQSIIGDFKPMSKYMTKIEHKNMSTAYEIYFSLYQQLSENNCEDSLALLKENFKPDFFDLIIVDECHRGSAKEDSRWREILDYFDKATKIGMTATPKETKKVSNIDYFGQPIYTYKLKDGIEDGFLAPYKVVRYAFNTDVFGYQPIRGKRDANGELVEQKTYTLADFDTEIVIKERTEQVAKEITEYMKKTDRFAKTIVFCVDIEHAERMRQALVDCNKDLCAENPKYVMRITGDNPEGKAQLDYFIDNDSTYPVIVTTSKLMTTGVNCQTCKNIVLDNLFGENGMSEFKQIIGRGTRIQESYNKLFFTILDFRNATTIFSDPDFNGDPEQDPDFEPGEGKGGKQGGGDKPVNHKEKVFVKGVEVKLETSRIQYYDEDGKLVTESLTDYTKRNVLSEFKTMDDFLVFWTKDERREAIINELEEQGILISALRDLYPNDVDDFDLICDIAYGKKPMRKSERAKNSKVEEVLSQYSEKCRQVLEILLEKYSDDSIDELCNETLLKLDEFNEFGSPMKIAKLFGGKEDFLFAVRQVQNALYA